MKFKYVLHPEDYAIGQIEKFYTDWASKGWHLKKHGMWFSKLEQGQPKAMKYRVEVLQPENGSLLTMKDEQKAVFAEHGWKYVDGFSYISILRTPADSDAEELYLEPAQQAETLKGLRRQMVSNTIQMPFIMLLFYLFNTLMGKNVPAELHLLWLETPHIIISAIAIILAFCISGLVGTYHTNKLYRQMKKGIPIDHSPKNTGRKFTIITYCVIVSGFILMWSPFFKQNDLVPDVNDDGYIALAEMGVEIPTGDKSYLHSVSKSYKESPFCEYWYVSEDVDKTEFEPLIWMDQKVYFLKNEDKSEKTAKALMNTSTFAQTEDKFTEIVFPGLEKVHFHSDLEIIVINKNYVGIFTSIFNEETRTQLLTILAEKWN